MKNIRFQLNRKVWLAIVMVMAMAFPALAQNVTVTGVVYDPDGEPCIGASVTVQGVPGVGASTDLDGNFRISAPSNGTLVVSYVGCKTQDVALNGRTEVEVHLHGDAEVLQELVVIGYGAVKKDDATGSVAVIKPDDIEAGLATSANDLLVGASPGVVVTTDGGNPGGGANIRIRGGASLNASNDPLVVIDGVPMNGSYGSANALTMISPENIESLTILKDASATAIYGSRASNGVIIITTKKGQSGKPQVSFSANWHMNTARKTWSVLTGDEFRTYINQLGSAHAQTLLGDANTNWQDEVLRTTISQDYNLSVGGTVGFLPYRVNASFTNNEGIIKTSKMQRTTVGFNLTPKFFNGLLQIQANAKGSYIRDWNGSTGSIGAAINYNPTLPVYTNYTTHGNLGAPYLMGFSSLINNDGNLETNGSTNPVAQLYGVDNQNKAWTSTGNLMIDYALHFLPELHLNLNLGYDVVKGETHNYNLPNSPQAWNSNYKDGAGQYYFNKTLNRNTLLDFYANYKKEFEAIKSNLDVMAGYSWQRMDYINSNKTRINSIGYTKVYDAANNSWTINEDPATAAHIGQAFGNDPDYVYHGKGQLNLVSFFGRLNYVFDNTYLLTFTLRDDGTSRFSKSTRWGLFPSLALGWKINNMPFFEGVDKMNEFKLRLGWGQTGQQAVGGYNAYTPVYSVSQPSVFYPNMNGGEWINPLYPNAYNASLKWETTTTWNVGVDMAWLNNRITASVDWYLRDTKDLLAYVPVPAGMTTTNAMDRNIGTLRNLGLEFNVGAKPIVTKDFNWTTGLNIAWNSNKITALTGSAQDDETFVLGAGGNPASANAGDIEVHKVGYPAFSFNVLEQVYDKNGDPIANCYVDQNGDGIIDSNDLVIKHSRDPKVTMTWNNTFTYKNWDLGFTLRASIGNYVFNGVRAGGINLYNLEGQGNILNNVLTSDYYFNDGTAVSNLVRSDYFLENAGFVRCDNITLGYTFPELLNNNLKLRLFGAVQNPFVITKYKGLDPEVFSGIDSNVYPRPVTATIGLVATF
ncbi:MAG: TonB-dependent receptor [Muribaculaceae bacterium]|nr:TonB-dependent receptor [Muribaculaceae bacterium]